MKAVFSLYCSRNFPCPGPQTGVERATGKHWKRPKVGSNLERKTEKHFPLAAVQAAHCWLLSIVVLAISCARNCPHCINNAFDLAVISALELRSKREASRADGRKLFIDAKNQILW